MAGIWMSGADLAARHSVKYRKFGPDVLPVWVAEMDVELAEPIRAALTSAVAAGDTGYAHPNGLLEAFAGFAVRRWGWATDPGEMLMIPDVMTGVREFLSAIAEPGAPVVVNTPAYPPFFAGVQNCGLRIAESPLADTETGWALDLDRLEADFAAGAAAYVLCNPHNPTGLVLTRAELEAIADLAARYGVRVVADEIHAPLVYDGSVHVPYLTVDPRGVALVSASKAWNLAGLKCAVLVAGAEAWPYAQRIPIDVQYGAGLLGVIANQAAFEHGGPWLDTVLGALDGNRRLLGTLLRDEAPDVGYRMPAATYLAWLDFRRTGLGDDPAQALLDRGKVALSNGPAFGAPGAGFARLNLASPPERLADAVRRIALVTSSR
jgi:cystathionine beta-lyase